MRWFNQGSTSAYKHLHFCAAAASASLQANCGEVEVDGDGVCPVQTGLLPGAESLVLPGVWHNAEPGKLWYGSQQVVPQWDKFLP
jgi:hypothetical protein